jgi:hypothetical protein
VTYKILNEVIVQTYSYSSCAISNQRCIALFGFFLKAIATMYVISSSKLSEDVLCRLEKSFRLENLTQLPFKQAMTDLCVWFRVHVEFFTNEKSIKERLQVYFIKNQRSSKFNLHISFKRWITIVNLEVYFNLWNHSLFVLQERAWACFLWNVYGLIWQCP